MFRMPKLPRKLPVFVIFILGVTPLFASPMAGAVSNTATPSKGFEKSSPSGHAKKSADRSAVTGVGESDAAALQGSAYKDPPVDEDSAYELPDDEDAALDGAPAMKKSPPRWGAGFGVGVATSAAGLAMIAPVVWVEMLTWVLPIAGIFFFMPPYFVVPAILAAVLTAPLFVPTLTVALGLGYLVLESDPVPVLASTILGTLAGGAIGGVLGTAVFWAITFAWVLAQWDTPAIAGDEYGGLFLIAIPTLAFSVSTLVGASLGAGVGSGIAVATSDVE